MHAAVSTRTPRTPASRKAGYCLALFAGLLIAWHAVDAVAHMGATGVVKQRMELMVSLGKAMKSLNAMIRGKTDLDPDNAESAARLIQKHGAQMTKMFPKGSMQAPTEARPEIWTDWERFQALASSMEAEAGKLAAAGRSGDRKAIALQFRRVGKVCSSCHKDFRRKKAR